MNIEKVYNLLKDKIDGVSLEEKMKDHTTFKLGGPVDIMIQPENEEEILAAIKICRQEEFPYLILGNGSNLLVRDGGIRGAVIKLNKNYNKIRTDGEKIYCQSGTTLTAASKTAMENSLEGLEFANGIPGTIGGAITMNAGAYGGEMKDVVYKVRAITKDNEIVEFTNEEMHFGYRWSRVQEEGLIVLGVEFKLESGDREEIWERMRDLTYKRSSKQPLEKASGGSTFKRPEGYYAAKLIDDAGLKGLRHGGAKVSSKHSGFVINDQDASCKEVLELIGVIKKTVKDKFGVDLETEIKIIGEDDSGNKC